MNIRSLSISGLITLDMHALNNEGAEGNHLHTRMVHITTETGELAVVNAISGDMLKHIQAEHLYHVAREKGLPLCGGCQTFDANRINADEAFFAELGKTKDLAEITNRVLERCVIDDIEGVLITRGERSVPRKSLVEFGWLVGVPERTRTEQYFHVKYDTGRRAGSGDESGANTGQNIFYRPASSGQYAWCCTWSSAASATTTSRAPTRCPPTSARHAPRRFWKACSSPLFTRAGPSGTRKIPTSSALKGC